MACHITIDGAVVLDREDVLRAVLLVNAPVVDELVQQLVFARADHLVGILYGFLIEVVLVGLTL